MSRPFGTSSFRLSGTRPIPRIISGFSGGRARRRALITRLGLPTAQPLRVFDVGCGTGITARQLARTTSWVFDGADLNIEALKRCSGGLDRVLYYDLLEKREEFRDRYDVAILFDVIEHIEPTRPFLEAVLFHLKPGGILLVNVPALMTLFSVYDKVAGHYRRYDRQMLAARVRDPRRDGRRSGVLGPQHGAAAPGAEAGASRRDGRDADDPHRLRAAVSHRSCGAQGRDVGRNHAAQPPAIRLLASGRDQEEQLDPRFDAPADR